MLPFLFAAFCLLEAMERHAGNFSQRVLTGIRGAGPLLGAVLGCVPQCGFSVLAANLFSGGMISAGTLLAVFLSTSDEAILMIMGQPESAGVIGKLLLVKVVIAVLAGYLIDFCFPKLFSEKKEIHDLCEKESCGCGHSHGVILPAWNHTLKLFKMCIRDRPYTDRSMRTVRNRSIFVEQFTDAESIWQSRIYRWAGNLCGDDL